MEVEIASIDRGDGARLVQALLADLMDRYGVEDIDEPTPRDLGPPSGIFLVARVEGEAVACGGVRRHADGVGELKRMYVVPAARRQGIARRLLAELERHAVSFGYARLRLETGVRQPEAMGLYESAGYVPIPGYGHYRDAPLSRCYEKALGDVAEGHGGAVRHGRRDTLGVMRTRRAANEEST